MVRRRATPRLINKNKFLENKSSLVIHYAMPIGVLGPCLTNIYNFCSLGVTPIMDCGRINLYQAPIVGTKGEKGTDKNNFFLLRLDFF